MRFNSRKAARQHKALRVSKNIKGTADRPRISVFRSNRHFFVQFIDDAKGVTLASASTKQLGLNQANIENAKKVGEAAGKNAAAAGITEAVFDRAGFLYHGKIAAIADAIRSTGIKF